MKTIFYSGWPGKLTVAGLTLVAGMFAAPHSAFAQDDDSERAPRDRGQRDAGPVQVPADFDEQAKAILAKSIQRYKELKSWHVEIEAYSAGRFEKKVTVDYRDPQGLVATSDEAKGIHTVYFFDAANASTLRDFDGVREYQVLQLRGAASNPRSAYGSALGEYITPFFAGEENVFGRATVQSVKYSGEGTVNGIAVDNITVTAVRRGQPVTIIYSIGQTDPLLLKAEQLYEYDDGTKGDLVETYARQTDDVRLADSAFKFTPPEDAKKVDRFTPYRGIQVKPGDTPFPIRSKDLSGKPLSWEQYKGKVVLLDFWATWCAPCRRELPNVKATYAKYKDQGFDILGVSLDTSTAPIKPFAARQSINWRQVYDGYWNGPISSAFNVRYIPSTILIGRDGKVAAVNLHGAGLESAIQAALAGPNTG